MFEVKCPCKTDHFTYSVGSCCFLFALYSVYLEEKKYIYRFLFPGLLRLCVSVHLPHGFIPCDFCQ